jgi:hypothetical protein
MSTQVIRYKCDYCNKELKTERGIANHENVRCYHNPKNTTCFTCGLFIDEETVGEHSPIRQPVFYRLPKCADGHDCLWQDYNGVDHEMEEPYRKFECAFYEPREEHPGEYVKFSTGLGGYRKVYLKESEK